MNEFNEEKPHGCKHFIVGFFRGSMIGVYGEIDECISCQKIFSIRMSAHAGVCSLLKSCLDYIYTQSCRFQGFLRWKLGILKDFKQSLTDMEESLNGLNEGQESLGQLMSSLTY